MTLTTNGKDWLARNAGRNNCFTTSGVSYRDADGISRTGSTGDVVNALYTAYSVGKGSATIVAGTSYDGFRSINGADLTMGDVGDAYDMESGSAQYCVGVAPPAPPAPPIIPPTQICTPNAVHCYGGDVYRCSSDGGSRSKVVDCPYGCTNGICNDAPTGCVPGTRRCNGDRVEECNTNREWVYISTCAHGCSGAGICNAAPAAPGDQPVTGPFDVWVGGGISCPAGAPTVTLDTTEAFAYFKATPAIYVGVMNIMVNHIHNECYAYFAWEMRMWDGAAGAACPTTTPELQEISRFLAKVSPKKVITLKRVDAGATEMVSGSFEIPSHFQGRKTICLSLWGNYSYDALVAELAAAGYQKEIDW